MQQPNRPGSALGRAALKFLYSSNGAELSLFGLCAEATG
jgi:hypothetical protein